jgi:hypothetical protein
MMMITSSERWVGGMTSFSSSSYGGSGPEGVAKSLGTVTKTVNGKTSNKTTVVNPHKKEKISQRKFMMGIRSLRENTA